jgi:hypothetical protein
MKGFQKIQNLCVLKVLKVFQYLWDNHSSEKSEFKRRFIRQQSFAMCQLKTVRKIKNSSRKKKKESIN